MKVSENNWWLYKKISSIKESREIYRAGDPLLKISFRNDKISIYVPGSSEYMITEDCVGKVIEFEEVILFHMQKSGRMALVGGTKPCERKRN